VARVFITGSSDGLGLMAAQLLIDQGHEVVLHGRNKGRSRDAFAAAPGALGVVSGDLSTNRRGKNSCGRGQQAGPVRRCNPQRRHRFSREAGGDGARSPERLCCQCARALHSDRADRKTEAIGLCKLRHASRRASAYGRSALDHTTLERMVGLRREQAVRCFAGICRRSPLEGRQIQRAGARMGGDKDGRAFSAGRSSSGVRNPGVADHERGRLGAIDRRVFLSSAPSCAEPDRGQPQGSGGSCWPSAAASPA
jgi:hypothetical protein